MSPHDVADVEGVLLSAALLSLVVLGLASLDGGRRAKVRSALAGTGMLLAAGVAGGAMLGSLWFSEVAGFPPCELCWYQRIAMYPLVVVLGAAALGRSRTARRAGLILGLTGSAVSVWHNLIETVPDIQRGGCDPTNPCTIRWVAGLDFWTIPRMSGACFFLILVLTLADPITSPVQED